MKMNPATVIGGIVALTFIVAALVIGILAFNHGVLDANSTPVIVMVIGLVAPTITGLLALLKAEGAKQTAESVQNDLRNGVVKNKVKEAIRETNLESDETAGRSVVTNPVAKPVRKARKSTTHRKAE